MVTILIAEDEKNIQLLLSEHLKAKYNLKFANNGIEALEILHSEQIDLLLTDVIMPGMDGFELICQIHSEGFTLPTLILTAKQSFSDKRTGFSLGTDDYLTKPFNCEELQWRIESLLRRARISSEKRIQIHDVILDEDTYQIRKNDILLELPKKEFELLYKLLSYPGMIFTKTQLLDSIWGYESDSTEDTIKTHISRLRNKLTAFTEFQIVTVKGLGYKAMLGGNDEKTE